MDRSKFNKNKFIKDPLHWAAGNNWPKDVRKRLEEGANPYRPNNDGLTPMHAAVAHNAKEAASVLLEQYATDLSIVKESMRRRFLWKTENSCWNKRPILIAWTEEECEQVQLLASTCPASIPFNVQIFVLLRSSKDGNRLAALDVCSAEKRSAVLRCLNLLLGNGVLSLDKSDLRKDNMTYLQTACLYGHVKMLELLISHGASLSATGDGGAIPLMTACSTMKKDIIKLLMTKYVNRYDPTVCDNEARNVFHILLQKNDPTMIDFALKAMIKYRQEQFGETESEAFNRIFPYEHEEYTYTSTWSYIRPNLKELCSKYVVRYRIDLAYKQGNCLNLLDLISRKVALDYCFEGIRHNPDLLRLDYGNDTNVLHRLLEHDQVEFVEQLYDENPSVRRIFEAEGAFSILREALAKRNMKLLRFVLKYHAEYLRSNPDKLVEYAIGSTWFDRLVYREPFSMLSEAFPEMQQQITETIAQVTQKHQKLSFSDTMNELMKHFDETMEKLEADNRRLEDIVDDQNRTLLHQAVEWNKPELVSKLLNCCPNLNRTDNEGNLPIFFVRKLDVLDMLYDNMPVGPSVTNSKGYNLLHHSCEVGHYDGDSILSKLLTLGFDVNQPTGDGNVPLSIASCCSTVQFLLKHGAKVELIDGPALGKTLNRKQHCAGWQLIPKIVHFDWFPEMAHLYLPWMLGNQNRDFFTCSSGQRLEENPEIRKVLFDSLYRHSKEATAKFFLEVCHRAINCCARWILDYGYEIDIELTDQYHYTPLLGLLSYMEEPNQDVVERLLQKGANVNARDDRGRNGLLAIVSHFRSAQWNGHSLKSIELLLDYGADINAQDEHGDTALHHAFAQMQLELVELLIARGANRKLRNNRKKLPYEKSDKNIQALYAFLG